MSDYEYEGKGGYPLFVLLTGGIITCIIMSLIVIFVFIPAIQNYNEPLEKQHREDFVKLANRITNQLSSKNLTCPDIQSLREQHITNKNWWKDPLGSDSNFATARDLWNAKNCGNHWGWFES